MSLARRRPSISVVSCVLLLFSATALGGCSKLLGIHEPKEKRDAADAADESHGSTSLDGPEVEVGGDAVTQDAGIDVGSSVPDASDVGDAMPDPSDALDAAVDAGDVADAMSELPPDPPDAADADAQDDARTDGPAGDVPPVVVDVMTVTLPEALYNVAYSAQLTASGGNGNPLLWTVSDGRLPAGIALDGNGLLHGKPRESGPFQVEVTASDQAGASGTRRLVLNVIRKRWLLFRANTNANDWTLFGLYAVDVRIPNVKLTVSSNIRADSGNVNKFEFSPDGAYVAFLGEAIKDLPQLFVVDMRGDLPGDPRKVNEFGVVRDFAWSPDSKFLAYPVEGDQALDVLVSDVTKPQVPGERVGNPPQYVNAVGFVTPNLLTYFSDAIAFMRRGTDGHFAAPAHLAAGGRPIQIWAELESALFASFGDSCMDSTWTLADFGTPIMTRQLDGYVSAAPRRDYLAHRAREDH